MQVSKAGKIWLDYHRSHSFIKNKFYSQFGDYDLKDVSVDNILDFIDQITDG